MRLLVILISLCFSLASMAQEQLTIRGNVRDVKSREALPGVTVQVLSADSTVLGSGIVKAIDPSHVKETCYFAIKIPKQTGKYIVRASFMGYRTTCIDISIEKLGRREYIKEIPTIFIKEEYKSLKDVEVVASKVKFYYKGDTVVYNADAFVLAEGSMLDALVKQLPGVEMRDDGKIYHNGKFVESLLLNGKDFFKGNQQVMLDNLPSYTVKQVKVYDKYGEKSEFLGQKLQNDKQYVLDVNLKREYNVGTLANIEAGGGTSDRYLGRLFALYFRDNGRVGLYGNINNLNDKRKPGENSNWTPENMPKGESKEKKAGVDYNFNFNDNKLRLRGSADINHQDWNLLTHTDRENFFAQGNTYEYERSASRSKNLSLSTQHTLAMKMGKLYFYISPSFNYSKFDNTSNFISGTFSSMQENVNCDLLENIYTSVGGEVIRKSIVNRYKKEGLGKGHNTNGALDIASTIRLRGSDDVLFFAGKVTGGSRQEDLFNRYGILYGENGTPGGQGYQYFDNQPDRKWIYNASLTYQYKLDQYNILDFDYKINHQYQKKNSSLYLLDKIENFDEELGKLPSMQEYESVMDVGNSYKSTSYETVHDIEVMYELRQKPTANGVWEGSIGATLQPVHCKLDYERGNLITSITRDRLLVPISIYADWASKKDKAERSVYGFNFKTSSKMPNLLNMVDIKDDTDPLNIRIGNGSLKPQTDYTLYLWGWKNSSKSGVYNHINLAYDYHQNAFAMGYSYDSETGVRTYRADNVNGNWTAKLNWIYNRPLDKSRKLNLKTNTRLELNNSVDLAGIGSSEGSYNAVRSSVHTFLVGENMNLDYKIGKASTVGLKLNGTWRDIDSRRENFQSISAWDLNYGLKGVFQLPWHLQFSTDLTMYTRRGYEGSSMNTDDLVWNARLTFTMLKGKLVWMLDGFDILNQLNNVTRVVNAQGRTETYTNALPRYAMLHVAYKLHSKPKRK